MCVFTLTVHLIFLSTLDNPNDNLKCPEKAGQQSKTQKDVAVCHDVHETTQLFIKVHSNRPTVN